MKLVALCVALCLSFGTAAGCERKAPEPSSKPSVGQAPPSSAPKKQEPVAARAPVAVAEGAFRLPGAKRVVGIGDLHGDFAATEEAFLLAGAIDERGKWAGGAMTVVQTGDQLDRGDQERQIIDFLERLSSEARAAGGSLVVLNGNHETMNVLGDFRYVAPGALTAFDGMKPDSPLGSQVSGPYRSRALAFLPGGGAARILARRPLVVVVGDTVFVHGGLRPEHVDYGLDKLNQESREWMEGKTTLPPRLVLEEDGPLWSRIYGDPVVSPEGCGVLRETLKRLGASRMAVGHTVQPGGMSSACDGQVFRIDVGLAAHYGDRAVQVLEIKDGTATILTKTE